MTKQIDPIIQEMIDKTMRELAQPEKPIQESRNWQDPEGCRYLAVWQNAALLRVLVRKFTETLPLFPTLKGNIRVNSPLNPTLNQPLKSEHRLIAQMDDDARSIIRNIEEGWKRSTTKEYLTFLGYSQGSLAELKGDIGDCKIFGYLPSQPLSTLKNTLNIDLRVFKGPHKGQGETYGDPASDPSHPYYKPLATLNSKTLTYEIFMELINKTDYLLRQLVVSLENKMAREQKYYQVEQIRLNRRAS